MILGERVREGPRPWLQQEVTVAYRLGGEGRGSSFPPAPNLPEDTGGNVT